MINGKIIKVCGMREAQNIRDVESLQRVRLVRAAAFLICARLWIKRVCIRWPVMGKFCLARRDCTP